MAINNPIGNYPDFIINDITASAAQSPSYIGQAPLFFSIDGPMSLRSSTVPYTLTISKQKNRG